MSDREHPSALSLLWQPWLLPRVAIRTPDERAGRLGAAAIGAIVGIMAGQNTVFQALSVSSEYESLFQYLITGLCTAGLFAVVALFLIRFWMMADPDDLTTELQRANRRAVILSPICILLPLAAWSIRSIALARHVREMSLAAPLILALPVVALLIWTRQQITHRCADDNRCHDCGYSLIGLLEPRCPECGKPFERAKLARLSPADLFRS